MNRAAGGWRAAGGGICDWIAKTPEALALYGVALAAEAGLVPLNTAYTAAAFGYSIGNASPKRLLVDPGRAAAQAGHSILKRDGMSKITMIASNPIPMI